MSRLPSTITVYVTPSLYETYVVYSIQRLNEWVIRIRENNFASDSSQTLHFCCQHPVIMFAKLFSRVALKISVLRHSDVRRVQKNRKSSGRAC